MKEILQEYGKTVLTAAGTLLLLIMLFQGLHIGENLGFFAIIKAKSRLPEKEYETYQDAKEIAQFIERKRPVITWRNVKVKLGSEAEAEDLFMAEDAEGNAAEIRVIKVEAPDKTEVFTEHNKIKFTKTGVYEIWVKATDDSCVVSQKLFYIPVGNG